MDWGQVAVQWLHVFGGIFWFGGAIFSNFVMLPAARHLPLDAQRRLGTAMFEQGADAVAVASRPILPLAMPELVGFFIVLTTMILMRFGV